MHRVWIAAEKEKYYKHGRKSKRWRTMQQPEKKHMSIIIDGMDQGKSRIPKPSRHSKATDSLFAQQIHVTGIMHHGAEVPVTVRLSDERLPKDSNATIDSICHALRIAQDGRPTEPLPEILYLQLDNCGGENKNKHILFFCALMVGVGLVKKIKLSFLPVGHTHEDIDQLFSRLAARLRQTDVITLRDMIDTITRSYTTPSGINPAVHVVNELPDFKRWFAADVPKMQHITEARVFRFVRDNQGVVQLTVRNDMATTSRNSSSNQWFPQDGYAIITRERALEIWNSPIPKVPLRPLPIDEITATIDKYEAEHETSATNIADWRDRILEMVNAEESQCAECVRLAREDAKTNQVTTYVYYHHCLPCLFLTCTYTFHTTFSSRGIQRSWLLTNGAERKKFMICSPIISSR